MKERLQKLEKMLEEVKSGGGDEAPTASSPLAATPTALYQLPSIPSYVEVPQPPSIPSYVDVCEGSCVETLVDEWTSGPSIGSPADSSWQAVESPVERPSFILGAPVVSKPITINPDEFDALIRVFLEAVWPSMPILHPASLLYKPTVYPPFLIVIILGAAMKFAENCPAAQRLVEASPWSSRSDFSKETILRIMPVVRSRIESFGQPVGAFEVIGMTHADIMFGAPDGNLLSGFRMGDNLIIMSREFSLSELCRTDRTGDGFLRWEELRRLIFRLFQFDHIFTHLSSIRSFGIPRERVEKIPLPCSDEFFAQMAPVAPQGPVITLSMFINDVSLYPLFLPQLSSQGKWSALVCIMVRFVRRDVRTLFSS
jgi:hypothetical protein